MKPYTKRDIEHIYRQLMKRAHENAECARGSQAVHDVRVAAEWAYHFNLFYADPDAEQLLRTIADAHIPHLQVPGGDDNRCVLIDSYCLDNRGLVQQYLRAIRRNHLRLLYVCTASTTDYGTDTLQELREDNRAEILVLSEKSEDPIRQARLAAEAMASFSPARLFLHLTPWDGVALMACHAVEGPQIFNINLTDHAFWLGASFIDYNLEFRPYGMTVSLEQRHLQQHQLLPMPFYPVAPVSKDFCGLPPLPPTAIKILTGGSLYKMMGKQDIFFRLMDAVLSLSDDVYILVAGFHRDQRFDDLCRTMKHGNRVVQIGLRSDINAVFEQCDIFLSTYPMIGGLMLQYAAKHGKPIIAYHEAGDVMNLPEEIVNNYQNHYRSYASIEDMTAYAARLIRDEAFRHAEGLVLQEGLMTEERFAEAFLQTITTRLPQWQWDRDRIDYDAFFERYLELENTSGFSATKALAMQQGLSLVSTLSGFRVQAAQALIQYMCGAPFKELLVWLMPSFIKHRLLSKK